MAGYQGMVNGEILPLVARSASECYRCRHVALVRGGDEFGVVALEFPDAGIVMRRLGRRFGEQTDGIQRDKGACMGMRNFLIMAAPSCLSDPDDHRADCVQADSGVEELPAAQFGQVHHAVTDLRHHAAQLLSTFQS